MRSIIINGKCIQNFTKEELSLLLSNIPKDKFEIYYDYIHKTKYITIDNLALKHNISRATLYRYVNEIDELLKTTY